MAKCFKNHHYPTEYDENCKWCIINKNVINYRNELKEKLEGNDE